MSEQWTPDELDGLQRLAEAATPGPWLRSDEYPRLVFADTKDGSGWFTVAELPSLKAEVDAAYIAAANPATVLQLIAQVRVAEWQPIETAPKQGEFMVLAYGVPWPAQADNGTVRSRAHGRINDPDNAQSLQVEYWQPLPPPPARREGSE